MLNRLGAKLPMIDPRVVAAMSVQNRKGVYALLLGAGISRSASIPTGWEVVVDLITRLAELSEVTPPTDPVSWYIETHGAAPTYSSLLGELGKTKADRSHLLRGYFEPSEGEKEEGKKIPTKAHRAVARLVAKGYFRVILTTNFDLLLERALADEGVTPIVVASPDAIDGMTPLQHSDCTILKLHGDYLNLSSLNTLDELAAYDNRLDNLLDRVLSEYGLIVCGWSAAWDGALRTAILRSTRHRFTTFWLTRGSLTEEAEQLTAFRDATLIPIDSADEFFEDLEQKVLSIEQGRTTHLLSPEIATATVKRFLAEDRFRIPLDELILRETRRLVEFLDQPIFPLGSPQPDEESIRHRLEQYDSVTSVLAGIFVVGCHWGTAKQHRLWNRSIEQVATCKPQPGTVYDAWRNMKFYPATVLLYAGGIAAIAAERYDVLQLFFKLSEATRNGRSELLIHRANARACLGQDIANHLFPPKKDRVTPGSDWLFERIANVVNEIVGDSDRYEQLFNRFELFLAMSHWDLMESNWVPDGRFRWQVDRSGSTVDRVREELEALGNNWGPLGAGLFSGSASRAKEAINQIFQFWS